MSDTKTQQNNNDDGVVDVDHIDNEKRITPGVLHEIPWREYDIHREKEEHGNHHETNGDDDDGDDDEGCPEALQSLFQTESYRNNSNNGNNGNNGNHQNGDLLERLECHPVPISIGMNIHVTEVSHCKDTVQTTTIQRDSDIPPKATTSTKTLQIWSAPDWNLSTGMSLCGGADVLSDFLQQQKQQASDYNCHGKTILELGAGTGICGLVASVLGAQRVVITDGDTHVLRQVLRRNVETNQALLSAASSTVTCHQLIWGNETQIDVLRTTYGCSDVILAADCLYLRQSVAPFWKTVDTLLTDDGIVLYAHVSSSTASNDYVCEIAAQYGLHVFQRTESGVQVFARQVPPPSSPEMDGAAKPVNTDVESEQYRTWREFHIHKTTNALECDLSHGDDESEDECMGYDIFQKDEETIELQEIVLRNGYTLRIWSVPDWSQSTGMAVCGGADILANFLQENADIYCQGLNILELGSGTGMCGLTAAAFGASRVLLSDGDVKVLREVLSKNVDENTWITQDGTRETGDFSRKGASIQCPQLIWGEDLDKFVDKFGLSDVIMASDCLYMKQTVEPFWNTVDKLLKQDGVVLYVNVCASMATKEAILETARRCGFELRTEHDDGVHVLARGSPE